MVLKSLTPVLLFFLFATLFTACNGLADESKGWIKHEVSQEEIKDLQQQYNEGHKPGLADPRQVAREFISSLNVEVDNTYETKVLNDEDTKQILQYKLTDGRYIELELVRPSEGGEAGIYVVNRYRFTDEEDQNPE